MEGVTQTRMGGVVEICLLLSIVSVICKSNQSCIVLSLSLSLCQHHTLKKATGNEYLQNLLDLIISQVFLSMASKHQSLITHILSDFNGILTILKLYYYKYIIQK